MKQNEISLPDEARQAFENYPQIAPSPAFNMALWERLESIKTRRQLTLRGRLENFLGLDLWHFAASGLLGALLPALLLGGLYFAARTHSAPPASTLSIPLPASSVDEATLTAGQFYARQWLANSYPPLYRDSPQIRPRSQGGEVSCLVSTSHLG